MGVINYHKTGDLIEINIRDYSGKKLESFRVNGADKGQYRKILKYLEDKYGFSPEIQPQENVGFVDTDNKEQIDWWA